MPASEETNNYTPNCNSSFSLCKRYTHISRPIYFLKVKCDKANINRKKRDDILNQSGRPFLKRFPLFLNKTVTVGVNHTYTIIRINTSKLCDKTFNETA